MTKREVIAVLVISLILAGLGIYNTVNTNTYHDHSKDAWRSTPADSSISVAEPEDE